MIPEWDQLARNSSGVNALTAPTLKERRSTTPRSDRPPWMEQIPMLFMKLWLWFKKNTESLRETPRSDQVWTAPAQEFFCGSERIKVYEDGRNGPDTDAFLRLWLWSYYKVCGSGIQNVLESSIRPTGKSRTGLNGFNSQIWLALKERRSTTPNQTRRQEWNRHF